MSSAWQTINQFRSSTFFLTLVICYAIFVDQLFFAFILPVLPYSLPERNGISHQKVQYWTTVLIVVFGIACLLTCPIIGWWTDRHASRRIPFLAGLAVLLTSTLLMWLGGPIELQVLSRVGQGIADAMIYIVGMTIMLDTVGIAHVAEYMGYVAIALNVGTFAGPLLGGVVFNKAGYNATWWMMLGFVVLDAILRFVLIEKTSKSGADLKDLPPKLSPESSTEQDLPPFPHDQVDSASTLKTSSSGGGVQTKDTMDSEVSSNRNDVSSKRLPALISLMSSMRLSVALYGICVQSMIFSGFETVLSLYVQEIWHYTSLGAGLIFVPLTIPAFFAPILGRIIDRTTPRWAFVAGFLGLCPVLIVARYVQHDDMGQKVLMCALLVLIGLGIAMALNPLMAEIFYVADNREKSAPARRGGERDRGGSAYAQAYALFAMAWSVGNIAGPLMCGLIKDKAGWGTMCWTLGLLSGTTAVPCFMWSGEGLGG